MKILLCGVVLLCLATSTLATEDDKNSSSQEADGPSPILIRTAYCACRCCEKNQEICFRHDSIPATYKCSESNCNEEFCEAWNKAKCMKDCFCEKCKGKIDKDDYRCVAHKTLSDNCKCEDKDVQCGHKLPDSKELNSGVKRMETLVKNPSCIFPCFCQKCKDSLPPGVYSDCLMTSVPAAGCECGNIKCPSQEVLDGLKKVREMRERNEGSAFDFSKEIDGMMDAEKAKDVKCKMQCYCDVCSVGNEKIGANCDKMLPKPRIEGCKCNPDDIDCPTTDVDQHCKIYCFCKGCIDDPRMAPTFKDSCKTMTKKEQGCMCAEEEDCSLLDKIPNQGEKEKKKKSKKGKLKPKKKDHDEL